MQPAVRTQSGLKPSQPTAASVPAASSGPAPPAPAPSAPPQSSSPAGRQPAVPSVKPSAPGPVSDVVATGGRQPAAPTRLNPMGFVKATGIGLFGAALAVGSWMLRKHFSEEAETPVEDFKKLCPTLENFQHDHVAVKIFLRLSRWKSCNEEVFYQLLLNVDNLLYSFKQIQKRADGDRHVQVRSMLAAPVTQPLETVCVDICKVERDQLWAETLLEKYHKEILARWPHSHEVPHADYWVAAAESYIKKLVRNIQWVSFASY